MSDGSHINGETRPTNRLKIRSTALPSRALYRQILTDIYNPKMRLWFVF